MFLFLEVEWAVFIGTIFSNVLFLALRSCIHHKIQLDQIPVRRQLPTIDTIIATQEASNAFGAQIIPLIVSIYMYIQPNSTESDPINFLQVVILVSNVVSACCITFLIFVSWKKGPEWWLNISPYFFFVALVINYLIIPIMNILLSLVLICDPKVNLKNQTAESFYVFFMIICISRVVEYFILIRRSILLDARIYLQSTKELYEKPELELQSMLNELKSGASFDETAVNHLESILNMRFAQYSDKVRGYGAGNIRIGSYIEMDDSIYSLGFISQINDELMSQNFDVVKGHFIGKAKQYHAKKEDDE